MTNRPYSTSCCPCEAGEVGNVVPPGATVIVTDAQHEGVTLIVGRASAVRVPELRARNTMSSPCSAPFVRMERRRFKLR